METKLYVGNLSYGTTEEDLRTLFAQAGPVTAVELIKDRDTGNSKGFAFVEMSNQADAEKAISMFNGNTLDNRAIKVNIAKPREERPRGVVAGTTTGDPVEAAAVEAGVVVKALSETHDTRSNRFKKSSTGTRWNFLIHNLFASFDNLDEYFLTNPVIIGLRI